jgi:signal transduction histidine kinase
LPYKTIRDSLAAVEVAAQYIASANLNFRDILTDRAYAETIVDTVSQPLLLLDPHRRILAANPASHRAFRIGVDQPEVLDLPALTRSWSGGVAAALDLAIDSTLAAGTDLVLECALGDQANRTMIIRGRRTLHDGKTLVLLAFEDVSERRGLERALQLAIAELERSNRDFEAFAAIASHDLQEPLRKIRAFGDRLQATCGESLPETGRQYLTRMIDAAARMQLLISDVLALARAGTQPRHGSAIDLGSVAKDALRDLDQLLAMSGGVVEIGELPVVDGNATELQQVFQNLIANAIKFRGEQPPVVRITAFHEPPLVVGGPAAWRIVVADEGIGFDQKYAERIFRPFERLHARGAFEGNGIGLALCRRIIQHHGGTIRAEATAGAGARFIIRLPDLRDTK